MKDLEQFRNCYDAYASMLLRLAVNQLGSWNEAEDIVQEVFLKWMKNKPFRDPEHEKRWLIRVTINCCRNIQKSGRKRFEMQLQDFYPADSELTELKLELADAILALDADTATMIYLYYYEGYSVKEIAGLLSVSTSKVKMRLSRGRQQLRLSLEESI